ncbi:transglycosylase family protein [Actinomarinicola tropica]|uniref:transglycosylase family protein n=1 Tax=Actinomarinicola tropica TaxID=2789776 RepID=UPI00189C1E48|nr:transglycosylase family protein [Actinomarinicola tropica]
MLTVLATVLAAPLLVVEIAPGVNASPDAALAAFQAQVVEEEAPAEDAHDGPARAIGSVSAADLPAARLLSGFTLGEQLRADAEAEAAAEEQARLEAEAEEEAAAEEVATLEAPVTTTTTAPPPPPPAPEPAPAPNPGGPTAAQWAALRQCESGGNYQAVSASGRYYGAYQFLPSTWDATASRAGRSDLVGVRPDHAAPADQDAMALALYNSQGSSPWPHCGRYLH